MSDEIYADGYHDGADDVGEMSELPKASDVASYDVAVVFREQCERGITGIMEFDGADIEIWALFPSDDHDGWDKLGEHDLDIPVAAFLEMADKIRSCGRCRAFNAEDSVCKEWGMGMDAEETCELWEGR